MLAALLVLAPVQDFVDRYLLEVNGKGRAKIEGAGLYWTADSEPATLAAVVEAARHSRFVFVGESHDQKAHHVFQAAVIEALAASGRDVVVGFEMFTRDNQPNLAPWTIGLWTKDQFIENANWKTQWGFDFALYEPIFDVVRKHRLPMAALNVPRDWVRQVGREGIGALTPEQRKWAPDPFLGNDGHKAVFNALMGGHPMTGIQGENIYSAQVTWDEGMATSALAFMEGRFSNDAVMVVCAGIGHMMYGQGINYRIFRKTGERSLNIACVTSDGPLEVSKGIGEFVFVSR